MKRVALERHLREHVCRQIDEGAKHTKWVAADGPGRSAVPRHREIKTGTRPRDLQPARDSTAEQPQLTTVSAVVAGWDNPGVMLATEPPRPAFTPAARSRRATATLAGCRARRRRDLRCSKLASGLSCSRRPFAAPARRPECPAHAGDSQRHGGATTADPVLDPETNLQYLQNRYYDPKTQNFLTQDPLTALTRTPYSYTTNNPTNNTDPTGLDCAASGGDGGPGPFRIGPGPGEPGPGWGWPIAVGGGGLWVIGIGYIWWHEHPPSDGGGGEPVQPPPAAPKPRPAPGHAAEDTGAAAGDVGASAPVGRSGSPIEIQPGTNEPGQINGRPYSGHAFDRMQGRGIPPSAVEDAINNPASTAAGRGGTTIYRGSDGVTVVVRSGGRVVTVW